ncbi:MAG: hypothetical protein ACI4PK_02500, partial [Oscillospiraceae bacterium]
HLLFVTVVVSAGTAVVFVEPPPKLLPELLPELDETVNVSELVLPLKSVNLNVYVPATVVVYA